jgi:hypothetical protein
MIKKKIKSKIKNLVLVRVSALNLNLFLTLDLIGQRT